MKALEILKAITENEGTHLWLDDGDGYPKSYIYEAIKELEELQQSNKELINISIEARKVIKNLLEGRKWDVQIVRVWIDIYQR